MVKTALSCSLFRLKRHFSLSFYNFDTINNQNWPLCWLFTGANFKTRPYFDCKSTIRSICLPFPVGNCKFPEAFAISRKLFLFPGGSWEFPKENMNCQQILWFPESFFFFPMDFEISRKLFEIANGFYDFPKAFRNCLRILSIPEFFYNFPEAFVISWKNLLFPVGNFDFLKK